MRTLIASTLLAVLLAGPALAQKTTIINDRGQLTGTASTSGNTTTYRDWAGREIGSAQRQPDGRVQYRDRMGRELGTATPRR
jgi:YD repeat-containing protein